MTPDVSAVRLTQYAAGGGCACKVPPGELERVLAGLSGGRADLPADGFGAGGFGAGGFGARGRFGELIVGLEHGDDGAAVRIEDGPGGRAVIATADFFTPVVDNAYDWGRIAAANALSDIYAMGGEPLLALNLLGWPREKIPFELAAEVLRGGAEICLEAGTHLAGGHSIDDPEPKYGLAVTGFADAAKLLRNDAATAGTALTLTKPLGLGVLNNRHKATGERFEQAITVMTTLNRDASRAAVESGIRAATDITGFGLLGHLYKMARASGVTAIVDARAVPYLDGVRESFAEGFVPGGSRRNLEWVQPHVDASVDDDELVLLADAQTSGGLLLAGELPGHPVIGELIPAGALPLVVR